MNFITSLSTVMYNAGKLDIDLKIHTISNESLITRGRNAIANDFLESGADYLFFIDADVGFNAQDFYDVISIAKENTNMEIITASYPAKEINWDFVKTALEHNLVSDPKQLADFSGSAVSFVESDYFDTRKPVEVSLAGTGFMLISKKLLLDFIEEYPDTEFIEKGKKQFSFFNVGIEDKQYYSEDFLFCRMVSRMGRKIWLLPWIDLNHTGSYIFQGSFKNSSHITYLKNKK